MRRIELTPRDDWQRKVADLGLIWHSTPGAKGDGPVPHRRPTVPDRPYWDESACWSFTHAEIDELEAATATVYDLFLQAGDAVLADPDGLTVFGIPPHCHAAIRAAWRDEPPALNHGRFDFGWDGSGAPKLFEFNCDTPTSLLEAAVIQWDWKEEVFPDLDQFTSLHDKLLARFKDLRPAIPDRLLHFTNVADAAGEDQVTVAYLRDLATQAGLQTRAILIDDIGWHGIDRRFVDLDEQPIRAIFKLYPWEWLVNEAFGERLIQSLPRTIWMEPIWKMIWSNKSILPILWSMFPGHPNLLEADFQPLGRDHVKKPRLAREGANVEIVHVDAAGARTAERSGGTYGAEGHVYQELFALPGEGDRRPVIGSWVVDGQPAGMGIREDGAITGNRARFVPHVIEG